jgi:EAL domain-containing protein (putative c-di-GMP-specific phosphodiesterase class I)
MIADLAQAAQNDQLYVVYQPIFDCRTRGLSAVEALLRWEHPHRGNVPAEQFIGVAEAHGLIVEIGDWVLATVCRQVALWNDAGTSIPRVCVNVSAKQLEEPGFARRVGSIIDYYGIPRNQIELELTETVAIANFEQALEAIEDLRASGVGLSIDDFGSGCTSFALAGRLPMDTLKIDRSLIAGQSAGGRYAAIVECVVSMAHRLGMRTVAEGIDGERTIAWLRSLGCDELQGYYLSRPLAGGDLAAMLYAAA